MTTNEYSSLMDHRVETTAFAPARRNALESAATPSSPSRSPIAVSQESARRVQLQPDFFGFLVDEAFLVGYGLGSPEQTHRNLPYLAAAS